MTIVSLFVFQLKCDWLSIYTIWNKGNNSLFSNISTLLHAGKALWGINIFWGSAILCGCSLDRPQGIPDAYVICTSKCLSSWVQMLHECHYWLRLEKWNAWNIIARTYDIGKCTWYGHGWKFHLLQETTISVKTWHHGTLNETITTAQYRFPGSDNGRQEPPLS